jgi:hypothetical protein
VYFFSSEANRVWGITQSGGAFALEVLFWLAHLLKVVN